MRKRWSYLPRAGIFFAGVVAGIITRPIVRRRTVEIEKLKQSVSSLEERLTRHENASTARLDKAEARIEEHSVRLAEMPSTTQIVAAIEGLLSQAMTELDKRLLNQAQSIDVLRTAVAQTDSLLERVVESIESFQAEDTSKPTAEDILKNRTP